MKLKRFLLRYDPPGIGLEVEEQQGGETQVLHKDLVAIVEVTSSKHIRELVDNLIEGEPQLLTRRRHRAALIGLLGRLYNVEVDPNEDEGEDRSRAAEGPQQPQQQSRADSPSDVIQEGQQVVLVGLKAKQQVHNGEIATVQKVSGKEKFQVLVSSKGASEPETVKVKGLEHLVPVARKVTSLAVGTHVAIRGLRNHIELNGCLGRVVECHEESHRFEVRATESGQLFRVKQENLIPVEAIPLPAGASKENREPNTSPRPKKDVSAGGAASSSAGGLADGAGDGVDGGEVFEPGSMVQLFGLKTAMNYNGQSAEVLSVDRGRGRYEIRLNDGSVKTIRAENVRLLNGPSKTSPRTRRHKDGGAGKPKA